MSANVSQENSNTALTEEGRVWSQLIRWLKKVFHQRSHPDEYWSDWVMTDFGTDRFPGIDTAEVIYQDAGHRTHDGRPAAEHEKEGTLHFGCGDGRFNEHASFKQERKRGCTATLVVEELKLAADPALAKMLSVIEANDLEGLGNDNPFNLGTLLRIVQRQEEAQAWCREVCFTYFRVLYEHLTEFPNEIVDEGTFDVLYLTNLVKRRRPEKLEWCAATLRKFMEVTEKDLEERRKAVELFAAVVKPIEVKNNGERFRIALIHSDNDYVAGYARSKAAGDQRCDVTIQRRSNGQVCIFAMNSVELQFSDIVRIVRIMELERAGYTGTVEHYRLADEADQTSDGLWHRAHGMCVLLNGSHTAPSVKPTALTDEQLLEAVRLGLQSSEFIPARQALCKRTGCTNTATRPCPWQNYGLPRCCNKGLIPPRQLVRIGG